MFTRAAALGVVIIALVSPRAAGAQTLALNPPQIARIDEAMHEVMAREHIAGMSIALAQRGRILYARGYGYRDLRAHAPADRATIYEIGSLTKQFTAACVLMLAAQGKLDLDAPLSRYIDAPVPWRAVTVRQLLSQVSGIPDHLEMPDFRNWAQVQRTPGQLIHAVQPAGLHFQPGTRWEYSNTNYFLLGLIIESTSGAAYATFLQQHILRPLNLQSTSYTDVSMKHDGRAAGYAWDGAAFDNAGLSSMHLAFAAGALSSNVDDLIAWNTALLADRVLPPKFTALMTTEGMLADLTGTAYGMGLMLANMYGRAVIFHTGAIDGFSASAGSVEAEGLQFVVLTNTERIDTIPIAKTLVAIADPPGAPY